MSEINYEITIDDTTSYEIVLNEQGPQGAQGEQGEAGPQGVGINRIEKTSSSGLIDTYTIYYSNNTTATFDVTNGEDGVGITDIEKTGTVGLVDTYTITLTDGNTYTFDITNGKDGIDGSAATITVGSTTTGDAGTNASVVNSGTSSAAILDFTIPKGDKGDTGNTGATGNGIQSISKTSTVGLVDTYTITYTNGTTSTFTVTNGADGAAYTGSNPIQVDGGTNIISLSYDEDTIVLDDNQQLSVSSTLLSGKQDTLVSGTNIKTINNQSLLGSGNIDIQSGTELGAVIPIEIGKLELGGSKGYTTTETQAVSTGDYTWRFLGTSYSDRYIYALNQNYQTVTFTSLDQIFGDSAYMEYIDIPIDTTNIKNSSANYTITVQLSCSASPDGVTAFWGKVDNNGSFTPVAYSELADGGYNAHGQWGYGTFSFSNNHMYTSDGGYVYSRTTSSTSPCVILKLRYDGSTFIDISMEDYTGSYYYNTSFQHIGIKSVLDDINTIRVWLPTSIAINNTGTYLQDGSTVTSWSILDGGTSTDMIQLNYDSNTLGVNGSDELYAKINDSTITFTQGGVTKGTITTNQSSNSTVALDAGTFELTATSPIVYTPQGYSGGVGNAYIVDTTTGMTTTEFTGGSIIGRLSLLKEGAISYPATPSGTIDGVDFSKPFELIRENIKFVSAPSTNNDLINIRPNATLGGTYNTYYNGDGNIYSYSNIDTYQVSSGVPVTAGDVYSIKMAYDGSSTLTTYIKGGSYSTYTAIFTYPITLVNSLSTYAHILITGDDQGNIVSDISDVSFTNDGVVKYKGAEYSANNNVSFDYTDDFKKVVAHNAMPSNTYDDLTLGVSGTTYTAPADGYYYFDKIVGGNSGTIFQYIYLSNSTTGISDYTSGNWAYTLSATVAVKKGDVVMVGYDATGNTNAFRFYYAVGSESEAS